MAYLNFDSRYDKEPETVVAGFDQEAFSGWDDVCAELVRSMTGKRTLVVDCYPGTNDEEILEKLVKAFEPDLILNTEDIFFDGDELTRRMQAHLTDDRVRGIWYYGTVTDFIDQEQLKHFQEQVAACKGKVLVYGFAAALVNCGDVFVYADLARWEIQLRYRKGMPNYKQKNYEEDILRKYKRGFFVEWRIADRHKETLYEKMDYYLDTNRHGEPNMVTGRALRAGLDALTRQPFRLVPYFDPGVWGGQWMKEVCKLDPEEPNYAWSFDGVPEENSLYLRFGTVRVETPAMNLTKFKPREFLGPKNFARFGAEYPIRFDFLDTMGGQNLSLQVHPLTEYIHKKFGMAYTQDESYYILDAEPGGGVYLGLKENVDGKEMIAALREAQHTNRFEAEKYVNLFQAKKHDHFLIPAGTVHCSSAGCMVLEVSATPYIFTFKLWDWDRVGLDGRPRPIHIDDGEQVIQFDRTTKWVKDNLINRFETVRQTQHCKEIKTGLHELEFIETHVFTADGPFVLASDGEFAMLNLVEGESAVIESVSGNFAPYTVHYAETFILPAHAGDCIVRPAEGVASIKMLKANIRH